jgi:hypothetical protein
MKGRGPGVIVNMETTPEVQVRQHKENCRGSMNAQLEEAKKRERAVRRGERKRRGHRLLPVD